MVSWIFLCVLFKIGVLAMGQCHEQAKERSLWKEKSFLQGKLIVAQNVVKCIKETLIKIIRINGRYLIRLIPKKPRKTEMIIIYDNKNSSL